MIKLIIFDLDGTLVDAYRAIYKSLNFTLRKLGYRQASFAASRRAVGWGDKALVAKFVKDKDVDKARSSYRAHHKKALLRYARVLPGAKKVLNILKERKIKLAIASNRPQKFTNILVKHLKLKKYFDIIACAKDKHEFKPNPYLLLKIIKKMKVKKTEAIYVGDMAVDVYAGKNAGIKMVAVLGGSSPIKEIKMAGPHKHIAKISDLLEALR
ncbi:MAG: HAD family hydrolase [Candidatus Omnitrophica bacterium]|nr:HAD family hydrolase [Candidatus Omnitrophota bacterium]